MICFKSTGDGYTCVFHLNLLILPLNESTFQGPQGEAGQEGAAGLHGEEVYSIESACQRFDLSFVFFRCNTKVLSVVCNAMLTS